MNDERGSWYLLTGLVIGAVIGLLLATYIMPVKAIETSPAMLKNSDRQNYRTLIAQTFLIEADTGRAMARLMLLEDASPKDALLAQSQRELRENGKTDRGRALAVLAAAVTNERIAITPLPRQVTDTVQPDEATADPTQTPTAPVIALSTVQVEGPLPLASATAEPARSATVHPTLTPQPTLDIAFKLVEQKEICDPEQVGSLIQVQVINALGEPLSAVHIEVSVPNGGVERFFTGLFPRISPGYADYAMVEGMTYNLRVGDTGELVQNLAVPQCTLPDGGKYPGSIQLIFKKP